MTTTARSAASRCAPQARRRLDSMVGTAAPARGFVLAEVPGGWGRHALTSSSLDPAVGRELSRRAVQTGLRTLLIRRPGRDVRKARTRAWAVVDSSAVVPVTRWGSYDDDAELLALELDGSAGVPSYGPVFLVCAHGRHDTCCAVEGRPVARQLAHLRPEAVWECSHVGGDRFAANVVVAPYGLTYGRVTPDRCAELVDATGDGRVVPDLLRGRCTDTPVAQAAVADVRRRVGDDAIDAVVAGGVEDLRRGRWQVRVRTDAGTFDVTVASVFGAEAGLLTCHDTQPLHPPAFDVIDIRQV